MVGMTKGIICCDGKPFDAANMAGTSAAAGGNGSAAGSEASPQLLDDENDEFCFICALGVRFLNL